MKKTGGRRDLSGESSQRVSLDPPCGRRLGSGERDVVSGEIASWEDAELTKEGEESPVEAQKRPRAK